MSLETPVLAALASPRRREILRIVWDAECTAGAIHQAMPDITFGAVSLQLRALSEAGLVESRAEQTRRYYRARREALAPVADMLERMWSDALWKLKLAAELEVSRRGPRPRRPKQQRLRAVGRRPASQARQKQHP
jgi:DNA-binding transcriptional ArsR family regulator